MHSSITNLRSVASSDFERLNQIRQDTSLQKLLLGSTKPISSDNLPKWIEKTIKSGWLRVVTNDQDECIGYVQLVDWHYNNRTAWLGIAIINDARGKGHGATAISLILDEAKHTLSLRKVKLLVRSDNTVAIKLYQRLGFRDVGTLIDEYFDGERYYNVNLMELLLRPAE